MLTPIKTWLGRLNSESMIDAELEITESGLFAERLMADCSATEYW